MTKFCLSLHCDSHKSYLFVNGRETYKFESSNKNVNCISQFFLGSISNKFDYADSEEVCLKGNVYDVLVDCSSILKSDILNIHKDLMTKNNII